MRKVEENNNVTQNNQTSSIYGDGQQNVDNNGSVQSTFYGQPAPNEAQENKTQAVSLQKPSSGSDQSANPQQSGVYTFGQQPINPQQGYTPQQGYNSQQGFAPQQNGTYTYGQPQGFNPQQNVGLQYQQPKKNKAGLVIGIIAALAAVFIIGIVVVVVRARGPRVSNDPEEMLRFGMENITTEMEAYTSALSEKIDFKAISASRNEQASRTNVDLSFTMPDIDDFENIGVEIDAVTDLKNKLAQYELSVGAYGFNMSVANLTVADNTGYLSIPLLTRDVYSLDLTNLGERYNNSAWVDWFGEELPDDFTLELFTAGQGVSTSSSEQELAASVAKHIVTLKETAQIALLKEKKEFQVDGKTVEYGGVEVTVPQDALNEFLDIFESEFMESEYYTELLERAASSYGVLDYYDFDDYKAEVDEAMEELLSARFAEDLTINVYIDNNGRIVEISADQTDFTGDMFEYLGFEIDFEGEERSLDVFEANFYFGIGNYEELHICVDRWAEVTEEVYSEDISIMFMTFGGDEYSELVLEYWNDWGYEDNSFDMVFSIRSNDYDLTIFAEGAFTDIVKGESYTLDIDDITLSIDGDDFIYMTGTITNEPFSGEIHVPDDAIDVLDMTDDEIEELFYGVLDMYY